MRYPYVTVLSRFHGGGVHSKHKTFEGACKKASQWEKYPKLAVAELVDGKYYRQYYNQYDDIFEFNGEDREPLPTRLKSPKGASSDYII